MERRGLVGRKCYKHLQIINVFTFTKYLGLDPETTYSYDASLRGFDYAKVALPRSFKVGVKLEF